MIVQLNIPDSIVKSIRLPENRIESELLKELAVALYAQEMLSFAQARELARMGHYEFGQLLGERKVIRHYGEEELQSCFKLCPCIVGANGRSPLQRNFKLGD